MPWEIELTETAVEQLAAISDLRTRTSIIRRIQQLAQDPELQGKPLLGELQGLYSVRAAGQRYRIIYRLKARVVVIVIAIGTRNAGSRRDIYRLAGRLIRAGLLGDASDED